MSILQELRVYLFPPDIPSTKLPLLPRTYISRERDKNDAAADLDTRYLKGKAVARTNRAARDLLAKHPDERISRIARIERRKRRREPRLKRAIRRLWHLWKEG